MDKLKGRVFIVGGAVRDMLLGLEPKDVDYVVVNSSEREMLELGFEKVGADFPVFLHPETKDEYALARAERKVGNGYHGFEVETDGVTLEDDLSRRDITINAMAMDPATGEIIDPFNGRADLENGIIRHVSDAFVEDPVRVLRVARFAARYGFTVHPDTLKLMHELKEELKYLTAERVLLELKKTLKESTPSIFFRVLKEADVLDVVFPEIHALVDKTQPVNFHPEGDAFEHTMIVLDRGSNQFEKFLFLCHDLGKGVTPVEKLPNHYDHDKAGVSVVEKFCDRIRVERKWKEAAKLLTLYHMKLNKAHEMRPSKLMNIVELLMKRNILDEAINLVKADDMIGSELTDIAVSRIELAAKVITEVTGRVVKEKYPNVNGEQFRAVLVQERVNRFKKIQGGING